MKNSEFSQTHGRWMRKFAWQRYGTLTFPRPVTRDHALSFVNNWLTSFGGPVFALIACEQGRVGQLVHLHLLVGGLHKGALMCARGAWEFHCGGDVDLAIYDSYQGAAFYVGKTAFHDPESVVYFGDPKNWKRAYPRKRGRRGQAGKRRARMEARARLN